MKRAARRSRRWSALLAVVSSLGVVVAMLVLVVVAGRGPWTGERPWARSRTGSRG